MNAAGHGAALAAGNGYKVVTDMGSDSGGQVGHLRRRVFGGRRPGGTT
ncbi:MAG TPA: hypothetical protein VL117_08565 [Thermoleophilia bacterium]|nr:hypothetical protein [Thermoleophilia bacterium]